MHTENPYALQNPHVTQKWETMNLTHSAWQGENGNSACLSRFSLVLSHFIINLQKCQEFFDIFLKVFSYGFTGHRSECVRGEKSKKIPSLKPGLPHQKICAQLVIIYEKQRYVSCVYPRTAHLNNNVEKTKRKYHGGCIRTSKESAVLACMFSSHTSPSSNVCLKITVLFFEKCT